MRVLIADDEAPVASALATALRDAGYDVDVVADGKAALDQLRTAHFDVLLCDWMMPDLEGTSIIQHVRKALVEQPLVLLLSGMHGRQLRPEALANGADDYLTKPCPPSAMIDAISAGLVRRAALPPSDSHLRRAALPGAAEALRASLAPASTPLIAPRTTRVSIVPSPSDTMRVAETRSAPGGDIAGTAAWMALRESLATTFGDCCATELRGGQAQARDGAEVLTAAVIMVDVARKVEVAVALYVSWDSGVELARRILHDPAPDEVVIRELLVELATNAIAGLGAALRREGYQFTLGLGHSCAVSDPGTLMQSFSTSFSAVFSGSSIRMTSVVGARAASPVGLTSRRLREGMVIAEDVFGAESALLFSAGSRVTGTVIEQLARLAPARVVKVHVPPARW